MSAFDAGRDALERRIAAERKAMETTDKENARLYHVLTKLDGRAADGIIRLDPKSARFVQEKVEQWKKQGPFTFSPPQKKWIEDLEEQHL